MAVQRGLGRGLDALLGGEEDEVDGGLREVAMESLQPGRYQPRHSMDDAGLVELAESIRQQGILQPILVRPLENSGRYEIVAGERRWRAAGFAGLDSIPVQIRQLSDEQALSVALVENLQREDLSAIDEARGIQRLVEDFSMTHEAIAKVLGRSRSAVSNSLRLLKLHPDALQLLERGDIDSGHARALLKLDGDAQLVLARRTVEEGLSVREVEQISQADHPQGLAENPGVDSQLEPLAPQLPRAAAGANTILDPDTLQLQEQLEECLGTRVEIRHRRHGGGKIVIHYTSLEQLDHVLDRLQPQQQES